ncbi:ribose transport system ATP-binding protein [Kineothrix alysoides]|uniref:Ribose transport system ATP-binding protein n=1 Tax=Kineothrix alysoides TaxID=1469948 RepID=A0A4R1QQY5_9FIRM|nr:sugar ABC transporter ATP-binding protein [Kineothrix alysoides]TCL56259.1 ribose transport system ATP-binding protein [Kineothrix alysoides]
MEPILTLKNITKLYPGVRALDDFSIEFKPGEIHALLGENGAGKSTLIKVISGAIEPTAGEIVYKNKTYSRMTPKISRDNGIEVIYQEFNLVDTLSAAENICMGDRFGRFVDFKKMEKIAADIFKQFKIDINPKALVEGMTPAHKQIVEISKAISKKCELLIMDEPSAPLTVKEVECMFDIIEVLKKKGITIIYISHRMDEIFRIADRVTVMRDGTFVKTLLTKETNRDELISLMVGRELSSDYPKPKKHYDEEILRLEHIYGNGDSNISFSLRKGEILGLAGLVGAGRTELARLIYGADRMDSGKIYLEGKEIKIKSTSDAIHYGIGLIPEDRKNQGCFLEQSIEWNIAFNNIRRFSKSGIVNQKQTEEAAKKYGEAMSIKTPSYVQDVKNLSGGNQQKVVIAKTLAANSRIIIFDEPTRGIDVGAKQEIYELMCALADEGIGIIMISSDMEELLGMSQRIIVLAEGKKAGELEKEEFSQTAVLKYASSCG